VTAINDRQDLYQLAEEHGWQRRELERTDMYRKGQHGVEVFFTLDALKGGTLYDDLHLVTHTRELRTVKGWLTR
jgi:hypothetical protein